jgi:hypothetical protein
MLRTVTHLLSTCTLPSGPDISQVFTLQYRISFSNQNYEKSIKTLAYFNPWNNLILSICLNVSPGTRKYNASLLREFRTHNLTISNGTWDQHLDVLWVTGSRWTVWDTYSVEKECKFAILCEVYVMQKGSSKFTPLAHITRTIIATQIKQAVSIYTVVSLLCSAFRKMP